MDKVQELLGDSDEQRAENYVGYRVIADHGRAATFMIADGVRPSSTGAGYVLRMITRRAARFGRKIGFTEPFLAEIAQVYIDQMGDAYPELKRRREHILRTITQEERKFERTLDTGLAHLDEVMAEMKQRGATEIPGDRRLICTPPMACRWKSRATWCRNRASPSMKRASKRRGRPCRGQRRGQVRPIRDGHECVRRCAA